MLDPIDAPERPETADDYDAIDDVVSGAFPSDAEARLVRGIRASREYIPALALVANVDGAVVGHVMVSHAELHHDGIVHEIAILAPLAVRREHQGRGIGGELVREVLARADALAEPLIVLEGSPLYYPRFGFRPASELGITMPLPDWAPPEAAMAIPLAAYRTELRGAVVYPKAFDLVE